MSVSEPTKPFFQSELVRIRVSVESEKVDLGRRARSMAIDLWSVECETRTVGILIGIEEDIVTVVFVVTVGDE